MHWCCISISMYLLYPLSMCCKWRQTILKEVDRKFNFFPKCWVNRVLFICCFVNIFLLKPPRQKQEGKQWRRIRSSLDYGDDVIFPLLWCLLLIYLLNFMKRGGCSLIAMIRAIKDEHIHVSILCHLLSALFLLISRFSDKFHIEQSWSQIKSNWDGWFLGYKELCIDWNGTCIFMTDFWTLSFVDIQNWLCSCTFYSPLGLSIAFRADRNTPLRAGSKMDYHKSQGTFEHMKQVSRESQWWNAYEFHWNLSFTYFHRSTHHWPPWPEASFE